MAQAPEATFIAYIPKSLCSLIFAIDVVILSRTLEDLRANYSSGMVPRVVLAGRGGTFLCHRTRK